MRNFMEEPTGEFQILAILIPVFVVVLLALTWAFLQEARPMLTGTAPGSPRESSIIRDIHSSP